MPIGFRARVFMFGLSRKAPWLNHLPKPYRQRCGACAAHAPQSRGQPTRNTN